jgi:uncharacterized repeat protein (TIGR01451 family)
VIGGYVYRGSLYPALIGHYLLIDYCSGHLWDLIRRDDHWQATEHANLSATGYVAFGQAAGGELYLIHLDGTIYALQENTLLLSISKSGPQVIRAGERLTYTLTITNGSAITATQLLVTDTLPTSAYYLSGSGGTLIDSVVQWTIPNLTGHNMTQTIFAVTTTETISNVDYRVSTVDDQSAAGTTAVRTVTVQPYTYLPLIAKSGL